MADPSPPYGKAPNIVSSTISSDRIGSTAGNPLFLVKRSVVSASMDIGVCFDGHGCRPQWDRQAVPIPRHERTTYATNKMYASRETACNILDNAAKVVRRVYASKETACNIYDILDNADTCMYISKFMYMSDVHLFAIMCFFIFYTTTNVCECMIFS